MGVAFHRFRRTDPEFHLLSTPSSQSFFEPTTERLDDDRSLPLVKSPHILNQIPTKTPLAEGPRGRCPLSIPQSHAPPQAGLYGSMPRWASSWEDGLERMIIDRRLAAGGSRVWVRWVTMRGSAPHPARGLDPLTPRLASEAISLDASLGIKLGWLAEDDHPHAPRRRSSSSRAPTRALVATSFARSGGSRERAPLRGVGQSPTHPKPNP